VIGAFALLLCVPSATWGQVAPPLGTADQFGALGNSGVTGSAGLGTTVDGDVGSSPTAAISNFPPSSVLPPFVLHLTNDAVVQQARVDSIAAFVALNQGPSTVLPDNMTGQVLTSGIYSFTTGAPDLPVGATLTLNGPGVFIFIAGSTLTANVNSIVVAPPTRATSSGRSARPRRSMA
jgi:hypothetical protein